MPDELQQMARLKKCVKSYFPSSKMPPIGRPGLPPVAYKPIEPGWIMANLDPRTRLAFLAAAVGAVLVTRRPETLAAESLLLLGGVVLLKADGRLGHPWHLFGPMIAVVFTAGLVFFDLQTALTLAARLFNLLVVSFFCFRTIDPEEMAGALRKLGIPFGLVFILSAGMRYVPLIGRKIRNILDAQQARGIDLRPRIKNISNFAALLTPLVVQAFVLSDELALAMESRGFGCKNRSSRRTYRLRPIDYILMGASLGGLCLVAWWERG
jgi:energy-coupling factor transport system permease protein